MPPLQLVMPLFRDKNNISDVAGPLVLATLAPSFARGEGDLFFFFLNDLHEKEVADVGLDWEDCQRREAELKRSCFGTVGRSFNMTQAIMTPPISLVYAMSFETRDNE